MKKINNCFDPPIHLISFTGRIEKPLQRIGPPITEALLGGVYAPCSLRHFTPFYLLPSIFRRALLFTNFHCSFFVSLCSLLLFNFSPCSLIISLAPCSIFPIYCCSLLPFPNFSAPCSQITFSLLPATFLILGNAPCSLGSQRPFSLLPDYP